MARRGVMFTFPPELIKEPIIYKLGQQFNVVTNIRRADVNGNKGWVVLELEGKSEDALDGIGDLGGDLGGREGQDGGLGGAGDAFAQAGQGGAGDFEQHIAMDARGEREHTGLKEKLVHRREAAEEFGLLGGKGAFGWRFHAAI